MGLVLSICKQKKRAHNHTIIPKDYAQTVISTTNTSPVTSSDKTQCSVITREPTNTFSFHYPYHIPHHQQIRKFSDLPLVPTAFYLPYNHESNITHKYSSNPYIAQAYNYSNATLLPSIHSTDQSQVTSISDTISTKNDDEHRTVTYVECTTKLDPNEHLSESKLDDQSRLIKRSASTPIDMFLIDISNEHALVGQPISMNIRHLILDTLQNHYTKSSTPIRIQPSSITTYAHENLLNYIPYVCERYPNVTIPSDQQTKNTLHIRVPSEFSRSLDVLT
ncbi:hypothetical protein I4U23_030109 [Adineta vaga]|nr:hypothetical protein I4U23_030109 [Adineta vaga]